jgi:hypothetical protein
MSTSGSLAPPLTRKVTRRLSSQSVTRSDLYGVPTVIGPEQTMARRSSAHNTAHTMELARHHLAEGSDVPTPETSGPATPEDGQPATSDNYAFAFDIDGVLIKGGEVIPEAIDAMKVLNGDNEFGVKV